MDMNAFRLDGKVALVTGASYGIGFAIASAMAEAGATIVFNDIKQELVDKGVAAYAEKGIKAHGYVCDVTNEDAVNETVAKIEAEVGVVDILVNNAGIIKRIPMLEMSAKDFRQVIDVDLNAPFIVAKAVIPGMKKSSVGALLPGIAIRITSPHTGRVVPITTSGMIWLKGPNIFPGYLGGPETDRDIFVDGWLKTGDIGSADEFGFLKIEGRISRFSKIGGEMVPHEALEAAIMNIWNLDPADEERRIAVVTIPDPVKGEAVALLTTLVTDYVHQARTLIRHGLIDQGLPALWCPKEIIPVERIPVLPSGKLDIKQCRMLAYEALNIPFEP